MKKIISVLVCLFVLFGVTLSVSAAGSSVSIAPSSTTLHRGDTFTVTANLSNTSAIKLCTVVLNYDTNVFQMTGGKCHVSNANPAQVIPASKVGTFFLGTAQAVSGKIFTFEFKVKSNAVYGNYNINVTASAGVETGSYIAASGATVTVACKHTFNSWSKVDGTNHTRKCTTCKAVETRAHTFDNGCDRSCNDCGATRTTSHNYKTEWSSTGEYHFHECSICGDWKDDERHTPGDAATELAPQICTVCERVLVAALEHVHDLKPDVQSDETGHWYNCTKCEEKADFAEHVYLFDCDALCDVCGYERQTEVEHTPGEEWVADETGHWHACTVCQEKTDAAEHTGDLNVAEPKCETCDHAMIHEHSYDEQWVGNVEEHWHECVCGDKQDAEAHKWDEGVVTKEPYRDQQGTMTYTCTVCDETDTAIIIETSRDLMPWWIACGALGVVVLAMGISLIVIIAKMNKKSTGKYAVK